MRCNSEAPVTSCFKIEAKVTSQSKLLKYAVQSMLEAPGAFTVLCLLALVPEYGHQRQGSPVPVVRRLLLSADGWHPAACSGPMGFSSGESYTVRPFALAPFLGARLWGGRCQLLVPLHSASLPSGPRGNVRPSGLCQRSHARFCLDARSQARGVRLQGWDCQVTW